MHIISKKRLREFWTKRSEAEIPLRGWYQAVKNAEWRKFADVKATFNSVDVYARCYIFDVGGNKYRIIAAIHFNAQRVFVRNVLTHSQYDDGAWKSDCECS